MSRRVDIIFFFFFFFFSGFFNDTRDRDPVLSFSRARFLETRETGSLESSRLAGNTLGDTSIGHGVSFLRVFDNGRSIYSHVRMYVCTCVRACVLAFLVLFGDIGARARLRSSYFKYRKVGVATTEIAIEYA